MREKNEFALSVCDEPFGIELLHLPHFSFCIPGAFEMCIDFLKTEASFPEIKKISGFGS